MIYIVIYSIIVITCVNGQDGAAFCANPLVEKENILNTKFLHDTFKQGWNIQFGNPVVQKRMAQLLLGKKDVGDDTDYSTMCLRVSFDIHDEHLVGNYSGFNGLTAQFSCDESNRTFEYECNFHSSHNGYKDSAKFYMIYFDGNEDHNSIASAYCYPDGTVGWHANSMSKMIIDEETKSLLDRFKSIGFDPNVRVPLQSENCP